MGQLNRRVVFQRVQRRLDALSRGQRPANGDPAGHDGNGADQHGKQDHPAGVTDFFFNFAVRLQLNRYALAFQRELGGLAVEVDLVGQRVQPVLGIAGRRLAQMQR